MKKKYFIGAFVALILSNSCNKEEKFMKRMEGNWQIYNSVKTIHYADGSEQVFESLDNAGRLVISEGSSDNEKQYDLLYIDAQGDTMKNADLLVTDEYRNRMVMVNAYTDTSGAKKNIVWTIESEKKNKQTWSTYGVDSTLFYPSNNHNPGAANNWVSWRIKLERE